MYFFPHLQFEKDTKDIDYDLFSGKLKTPGLLFAIHEVLSLWSSQRNIKLPLFSSERDLI